MHGNFSIHKNIAVIGTGISGMSAAWLLSQSHDVTVYECDRRVGGHSNTVTVQGANGEIAVDTGFIVYNELTYPNLTALFDHLDVPTAAFGHVVCRIVRRRRSGIFRQHLARACLPKSAICSGRGSGRCCATCIVSIAKRHATSRNSKRSTPRSAIISTPAPMARRSATIICCRWRRRSGRRRRAAILSYPAAAFIRFHDSHGLVETAQPAALANRARRQPRLCRAPDRSYAESIACSSRPGGHGRGPHGDGFVKIRDRNGAIESFDDVVIALPRRPGPGAARRSDAGRAAASRRLPLQPQCRGPAFRSAADAEPARRVVELESYRPRRRRRRHKSCPTVTYWMNSLQNIPHDTPLFVTLNPPVRAARANATARSIDHPLFDAAAIAAQRQLWSLQGRRNTWFAGAYFGAGFHEDGLQAGLAVAEALGGVRRPWTVANESGRIALGPTPTPAAAAGARRMSAATSSTLYVGSVMHRRLRPRPHRLRYRVFWMLLDLDEIDEPAARPAAVLAQSLQRPEFLRRDHGDGSARPLRAQVEST